MLENTKMEAKLEGSLHGTKPIMKQKQFYNYNENRRISYPTIINGKKIKLSSITLLESFSHHLQSKVVNRCSIKKTYVIT